MMHFHAFSESLKFVTNQVATPNASCIAMHSQEVVHLSQKWYTHPQWHFKEILRSQRYDLCLVDEEQKKLTYDLR